MGSMRSAFSILPTMAKLPSRRVACTGAAVLAVVSSVLCVASEARATADTLLGAGPHNSSLAQADVADADAIASAYVNPASAWKSGLRLAVGYNHGFSKLKLNGDDAGVRDIAGTQLQLQLGSELLDDLSIGGAIHAYLPNRSLARIEFSPGVEPSFVRFQPAAYRATGLVVMAVRWSFVSIGVGLSMLARAEGDVDFTMGQDGQGVYADGSADVATPYDATLVAGLGLDLGGATLGLRYRGAQAFTMRMSTRVQVAVQGNPLNGVTEVTLSGSSGYVPASVDFAASWKLGASLRAMSSLQLARWSQAPTPAIDLGMDVNLGMSPGMRQVRFVRPQYRDTLSPRVGVEWMPTGPEGPWAVRVGYAWSPSPVSQVRGFATPVDANYHVAAAGAGFDLGEAWGVGLRIDAAAQLLLLEKRTFNKRQQLVPFSEYSASGSVLFGALAFQGQWQ